MVLVMVGVEGLGRRVMAGSQSPLAADLGARLDQLGLQVNTDNVLQVGKALLTEADRLRRVLYKARPTLRMLPPGGDPVSGPATDALNEKLDGLSAQCEAQVNALRGAAAVLADTARAYGKTEQEIHDWLGNVQLGPQTPPAGAGWAPL